MKINANEISSVLTKCKKFVSQQEFVPFALKCFKFQGNLVMGMDRRRGIVYELGEGYDFGEFLTAANFMVRIFSHVEGEAEIEMEENCIKIEAGKFRTKIPLYREEYFFPEFNHNDSKSLPRNFLETVKKGYFAACKDTSRERLRGVFWDKNILYTTDNLRLARCTTDLENESSLIVPDDLLEILITEEESPESYAIVENKFWFLYKDHKAFASTVREPFPDCETFFNSFPKKDHYCTFGKADMSSALKRMQPFCEGSRKRITVKVEEGNIIFRSRNSDGEAEEQIECEGGGDWGTFSVSHDLFESCATRMSRFQYAGDLLYFQEGDLECLLKILD